MSPLICLKTSRPLTTKQYDSLAEMVTGLPEDGSEAIHLDFTNLLAEDPVEFIRVARMDDGYRMVIGCNAYPYNYNSLLNLMNWFF